MSNSIVLDAGHVKRTLGKQTPPYEDGGVIHESEQNYPIMFEVARQLNILGFEVNYTNINPEVDLDVNSNTALKKRIAVQKTFKPDITISFHKNATADYKWNDVRGVEVWCATKGANGERLSKAILDSIIKYTGDKSRGIKYCDGNNDGDYSDASDKYLGFVIDTYGPTALCEIGFMTNRDDADRMLSTEWHYKYASGVVNGVCNYFGVKYIQPPMNNDDTSEDKLKELIKACEDAIISINDDIDKLKKTLEAVK